MSQRFEIGWYNGWSPEQRLATLPAQREALRTGAIPRPTTCSICGVTPEPGSRNSVWLHDENYADPLAAYHVCRTCHRTLHERFEKPAPWLALVSRHGNGSRWFEALTIDPASLRQSFELTYPNGLPRETLTNAGSVAAVGSARDGRSSGRAAASATPHERDSKRRTG